MAESGTARYYHQPLVARWRLRCEAHTVQQVGEAPFASQLVESGIHPERRHSIGSVAIGLFQPGKTLFLVSERRIQASYVKAANITLARLAFDSWDHCVSLILTAGKRVSGCGLGQSHGAFCEFRRAICGGQRLLRLAKFRIGERQADVVVMAELMRGLD